MRRSRAGVRALVCFALLSLASSIAAWASTQPSVVSVHVQPKPSVTGNVHVSFHPIDQLLPGGYYYAVIVLKPYRHYTRTSPPPCAASSDMLKTDYGYPHPEQPVKLALTPAKSVTGYWCPGGTYTGAVYAVPHAPPCESTYPCRSEPYEPPSPCWELESGHKVCGEVAQPKSYTYPEGPPKPIAKGARIIGRFTVTFRR